MSVATASTIKKAAKAESSFAESSLTGTQAMPSFDTLSYAKALLQGGVPTKQAEAMATGLLQYLQLQYLKNEVATKSDIAGIRTELKVIYWVLGILVIGNVASISLLFSFVLAQS